MSMRHYVLVLSAITGNAFLVKAIYLCHPFFIYGSLASPVLSRTPITGYIYSRKPILAPQ
jgi:hypothetical protein